MTLSSYSNVFGIHHDREHDEEIREGDLVRMGSNHFPHYEILAVRGDRAWVRNVTTGADSLTLVARCRLLEDAALRQAAE